VLLPYEADGELLGGADTTARLVVPGDERGSRYVSNVVSVTPRRGE
jgi:hypothetical protein